MNDKLTICRNFTFDAGHHLPDYNGKCANRHGHRFHLQVEVEGMIQQNGMLIDFGILKKVINAKIIEVLDHSYLNDIIPNPTAENILAWIYKQLYDLALFSKVTLSRLRLYETPDSYAEWTKG